MGVQLFCLLNVNSFGLNMTLIAWPCSFLFSSILTMAAVAFAEALIVSSSIHRFPAAFRLQPAFQYRIYLSREAVQIRSYGGLVLCLRGRGRGGHMVLQ